jgi:hypothetical protein
MRSFRRKLSLKKSLFLVFHPVSIADEVTALLTGNGRAVRALYVSRTSCQNLMVSPEPHGLTSFPSRSGRSCATSYAPIGSRDGVFLSQTSHNLLYVRCTPVEFLLQEHTRSAPARGHQCRRLYDDSRRHDCRSLGGRRPAPRRNPWSTRIRQRHRRFSSGRTGSTGDAVAFPTSRVEVPPSRGHSRCKIYVNHEIYTIHTLHAEDDRKRVELRAATQCGLPASPMLSKRVANALGFSSCRERPFVARRPRESSLDTKGSVSR